MVVSVEVLLTMPEFENSDIELLSMKLEAIEHLIRSYTNNNFQNTNMRINVQSLNGDIVGVCPFFKVGDTVQISSSQINDDLYTIKAINDNTTTLDKSLYDNYSNLVTKIVYPKDVQKGVIDMMVWEQENRQKVGIKSETLSRHSVTYYDQDTNNQVMGYPVAILGFLKPYMKARF